MNRILLSLLFTLLIQLSFAAAVTPPDSTSSLVDRTASLYLLEEGKTMYGEGKVRDALIKFRESSVRDPYSWRALYWISKCHYRMDNFGYALKYGQDAIALGQEEVDNEIHYILGLSYHRMAILDTAIMEYQKAIELLPKIRSSELLIQHNIDECEFAKKELANGQKHMRVAINGEINSGYNDYNIVLTGSDTAMYFVSRRSNTTGGGLNPDDQLYFEDTYLATYDPIMHSWDEVTNDLGKLNSEGFDALNYVSPDGLWGIITLNNTEADVKKTTKGSDICEIKLNKQGTWNSPKAIKNKTINTSFFEGSATLTADGNVMYFVSDRKGEKKSTDIYMVERKDGKDWGTAKPLPDNINTKGRETTPFITPDGQYLFFSSDGLLGMGGTDVFVSRNLGDSWSDPINLGNGVNTVNNDTHFIYSSSLKKAYVSGLQIIGNKASIDVFEIDMSSFQFPK